MLEARGVDTIPSNAWVTRFNKYCNKYFAKGADADLKIIARMPRGQDRQRAAVGAEEIARYFYRMESILKRKPKAVVASPLLVLHLHALWILKLVF